MAMRVNIVTVRSGWILQKIAERISDAGNKAALGQFSVSHEPHAHTDVNFYCDVQNCYFQKTPNLDIGLFTHVHADEIQTVNRATYSLDYIFHMASRYIDMFAECQKYPRGRMSLMIPWEIPAGFDLYKPTIGIFQRGKYEGKGFYRMLNLMESDVAKRFKWMFVGNDWEEVIERARENNVVVREVKDDEVTYPNGYSVLYDQIDYLLIPSKWEGGPICALEALAKGKKIISSDVGFIRDVTTHYEIYANDTQLKSILNKIIHGLEVRRSDAMINFIEAEEVSYRRCAEQIVEVAAKL